LFVSATWRAALAFIGAPGGQQPQGVSCVKEAKGTGPRKLEKVRAWGGLVMWVGGWLSLWVDGAEVG